MAGGDDEYRALTAALEVNDPGCLNDPRFIVDADELTPDDIAEMKRTCRACPTNDACALYAAVAKPSGGMWCGRHYPASERRRKESA